MNDLVIVTGAEHFESETQTSREPDDILLLAALGSHGARVRVAVWNDPEVDWAHLASRSSAVIVRSCWDYHINRAAFLAWAQRVESQATLLNPSAALRWNTHKRYLSELARWGTPVIPTIWVPQGMPVDVEQLLAAQSWPSAVLKPVVSTNAFSTLLVDAAFLASGQAQAFLAACVQQREMMIQPFIETVVSEGEHSLVFIAGEHTHAFRKRAVLCGEADRAGERSIVASDEEVALAKSILTIAATLIGLSGPSDFLYARVDLIEDAEGTRRLMELELVEPRLRLDYSRRALERLVATITTRAAGMVHAGP